MTIRILVLALIAIPTLAPAQALDPCAQTPQTCATLINTHATSRTRIPNTAVDVSIAITASDKDLPTVQRTLGAKSATLLNFLRAQQVQRLITTNISFQPDTRFEKNAPNKTVGYNGTLQISFRTSPDKAPDVLTGCLTNGANSIARTTFTPTEEEIDTARRQLSAEATKTAMAQAESIATAAGMHIASLRQINVDENQSLQSQMMFQPGAGLTIAEENASMPNTAAAAGQQVIAVAVNLVAAATH